MHFAEPYNLQLCNSIILLYTDIVSYITFDSHCDTDAIAQQYKHVT